MTDTSKDLTPDWENHKFGMAYLYGGKVCYPTIEIGRTSDYRSNYSVGCCFPFRKSMSSISIHLLTRAPEHDLIPRAAPAIDAEYTQGICADGAAILKDGKMTAPNTGE